MSDADIADDARLIEAYYRRGDVFATVVDVRQGRPPSAKQRAAIAANVGGLEAKYPRRMLGSAVVVDGAIQKGLLTALLWLARPQYPTEVVVSVQDGVEYCAALLAGGERARRTS